jgi:hypothetical protein
LLLRWHPKHLSKGVIIVVIVLTDIQHRRWLELRRWQNCYLIVDGQGWHELDVLTGCVLVDLSPDIDFISLSSLILLLNFFALDWLIVKELFRVLLG